MTTCFLQNFKTQHVFYKILKHNMIFAMKSCFQTNYFWTKIINLYKLISLDKKNQTLQNFKNMSQESADTVVGLVVNNEKRTSDELEISQAVLESTLSAKKRNKVADICEVNILPTNSRRTRTKTRILNLDSFDDKKESYEEIEYSEERYDKIFKEQLSDTETEKEEEGENWEDGDQSYSADDAEDDESEEEEEEISLSEEIDEAEASDIEAEEPDSEDEVEKEILESYKNNGKMENTVESEEDEEGEDDADEEY